MTAHETFMLAFQNHQAGNLPEAEKLYRQILAAHPNHPDTLHLLGVVYYQANRADLAIDLIRRAIALNPNADTYYTNYGLALAAKGQLDQAIAAYRRALALRPNLLVAMTNLSIALYEKGDLESSKAACLQALSVQNDHVESHFQLGRLYKDQGQLDQAIDSYRRVVAARPDFAKAHYNLANALQAAGKPEEAVASYEQAVALDPLDMSAYCNLGAALSELGLFDESIETCRRALALKPDHVEALCNLGNAFQLSDDLTQAIDCYRHAITIQPNYADAHANLGSALQQSAAFDQAVESFNRAIALKPDHHMAHWDLSLALLIQGDFARGWPEFEWGWSRTPQRLPYKITGPKWDGSPLAGKRILIHNEWALGDAIQMIRYLPLIAERGGRISVSCQRELHSIFTGIAPVERYFALQEPPSEYDVQCAMTSLPAVFKTNFETIPSNVPYLKANPDSAAKWRDRIPTDSRLKVGFVWLNKPSPAGRCPLVSAWTPLNEIKNVWWCSLQKPVANIRSRAPRADGPKELSPQFPPGLEMTDWTNHLNNFADTAALIENLDLILCVDTAVAHLAGAMGKRTWLLLKYISDWRWLMNRTDSPWYPTMRLFRQPRLGDWTTPILEIADALNNHS